MIPRDIETTEQWQVRWQSPMGEIVRTGNEAQMRYLAGQRAPFGPVLEKRTITVGPWVAPCPDPYCDYDPKVDGQHRHPDSNVLETDNEEES